jgi:NAD(P)-dependent dehydrogenase (short-subunit alcohol dehydrogenase family)
MGRLDGKAALVTGAGSGIGRACALRFAAEGARVAVNDVREDAANETVAAIESAGGTAYAAPGDVGKREDVDRLIGDVVARWHRLDVLVNNAASPLGGLIAGTTDDAWHTVFATTLDGTFYGVRAAINAMSAQGGGSIINVSSGAGLGGEVGLGAYGAAKAAVINLTKTAAVENAAANVRVNCICPGAIETPPLLAFVGYLPGGREAFERQIPARRFGRPEEIAAVAVFLASDEASYVTGCVLVADGGVNARTASPRFD